MKKKIVVSPGYELTFTQTNAKPGDFSGFAAIEIEAPRLEASQKSVLVTSITWTAAGCILSGGTFTSGAGSILATSVKTTADGLKILREGDKGACAGIFGVTGTPPTVPCACSVEITKAGQDKAECK